MQMQGVLIGFGVIAMGHLKAYEVDSVMSVVAVVDACPARREAARAAGLRAYDSYEACQEAEQVDFVDICTPPSSHSSYMIKALDDGLDVLCEKPVFLPTDKEFPELQKRLTSASGTLYPIHNYKFAPVVRRMREIVGQGRFGEVVSAHFRTIRVGHARGVADWNPDWRRNTSFSSGGIIRDHGPHSLYMAEILTGAVPRSVSCIAGTVLHGEERDTEDTALVRVRCDRDIEIMLDLTWGGSERLTRYSLTGTRGSILVENDRLTFHGAGGSESEDIPSDFDDPSHSSWFAKVLHDFRLTRTDKSKQRLLHAEAHRNALVIEAAYESCQEKGKWVDLPSFDDAEVVPGGYRTDAIEVIQ